MPAPLGGAVGICFNGVMSSHRCGSQSRATRVAILFSAAAFSLLLTALIAGCGSDNDTVSQQWLHGAWELTFNPDRDSDDELVFKPNGLVRVHTESNRDFEGKYQVSDDTLIMVMIVNDVPVEVRFGISPDKTRLVYENGAYYMKKGAARSVMPEIAE